MIEPLPPNTGDVRDGMEVAKINEIIGAINKPVVSAQPHLVTVERNEGGIVFDFSGLIDALNSALGSEQV